MAGIDNLLTGVQHDERAGAIGALDRSRLKAALADSRSLLIAGDAEDG